MHQSMQVYKTWTDLQAQHSFVAVRASRSVHPHTYKHLGRMLLAVLKLQMNQLLLQFLVLVGLFKVAIEFIQCLARFALRL